MNEVQNLFFHKLKKYKNTLKSRYTTEIIKNPAQLLVQAI